MTTLFIKNKGNEMKTQEKKICSNEDRDLSELSISKGMSKISGYH